LVVARYTFDYLTNEKKLNNLLQARYCYFIRLWFIEHARSEAATDPDVVASPMPVCGPVRATNIWSMCRLAAR